MAAFQKAFSAIDTAGSGVITISELKKYMEKMNYKESFVTTWISLFDPENTGIITYKQYCDVLGLEPSEAHSVKTEETTKPPVPQSGNLEASPPKSPQAHSGSENGTFEQGGADGQQPELREVETVAPVGDECRVGSFDETDGGSRQQSTEPVDILEEPIHSVEIPRVESKQTHRKKRNTNSFGVVEPEPSSTDKKRSPRRKRTSKSLGMEDPGELSLQCVQDPVVNKGTEEPQGLAAESLQNDEKPEDSNCCGSYEAIGPTEASQLGKTPPQADRPHHEDHRSSGSTGKAEPGNSEQVEHRQKSSSPSRQSKASRQKHSSSSDTSEPSAKSKKASKARRRNTTSSTQDEPSNQAEDVQHTDSPDSHQPLQCESAIAEEISIPVHQEGMENASAGQPTSTSEKGSKKQRRRNAKSFGGSEVSPLRDAETSQVPVVHSERVSPSLPTKESASLPKNKKNKGGKKNANSTSVETEGPVAPEATESAEMEPAASETGTRKRSFSGSLAEDAGLVVEETVIQPVESAPVTEASSEFTDAKSRKRRKTGSASTESECDKGDSKGSVEVVPSEKLESTHVPDIFDLLMECKDDDLMPDMEEAPEPVATSAGDEEIAPTAADETSADPVQLDHKDVHEENQADMETVHKPSDDNDVEMAVVKPVHQEPSLMTPTKDNTSQDDFSPTVPTNQTADCTCLPSQPEDLTQSEAVKMDEEPCVRVEEVECEIHPAESVEVDQEPSKKDPEPESFIEPVVQPVQSTTPVLASPPDTKPPKPEHVEEKKSPTKKASTPKEKTTKKQSKTTPVTHQSPEQHPKPVEDPQATQEPPHKSNRPANKPQSAKSSEAPKKRKAKDIQSSPAVSEPKTEETKPQQSQPATVTTPNVETTHTTDPTKAKAPKKEVAKVPKKAPRQTKSSTQSEAQKGDSKSSKTEKAGGKRKKQPAKSEKEAKRLKKDKKSPKKDDDKKSEGDKKGRKRATPPEDPNKPDGEKGKKRAKRPRNGHLECGRFPRAFETQVSCRVPQHRRDGALVSTHALGKAVKGQATKTSLKRRQRDKPSRGVLRWKVRESLRKIGTVVILLAGRHRGKRAVLIGRHKYSGLLLVTGPYKANGIPVRRVHPDYVIATKTSIKLKCFKLPKRMQTKTYFARSKPQKSKKDADSLFVQADEKEYKLRDERKVDQSIVDKQVIAAIKRTKCARMLLAYLRSQFSLSRHDYPHKMVF